MTRISVHVNDEWLRGDNRTADRMGTSLGARSKSSYLNVGTR